MSTAEAFSQATVAAWLERARAARASAWSQDLELNGIDLVDVILSPLFLNCLKAVRAGVWPTPDDKPPSFRRAQAYLAKIAVSNFVASWQSHPAERAEVLFWPRHATHWKDQLPVWTVCQDGATSSRFLACDSKVFSSLRKRDARPVFAQGAWPARARDAVREGRRRAKRLAALTPCELPPFDPAAASAAIASAWQSVLLETLPAACRAVVNAQEALDAFGPRVVVVGNDLTLEGRAACLVAQARGVPVVVLMHGHVGKNNGLHALHRADTLVVYGDAGRRILMSFGIPNEAIVVCGAPYLDRCPRPTRTIHPSLQRKLGLKPDAPWVLAATSGPGHSISHRHHLIQIEALMRLSEKMPDMTFIAKLHPKDLPSYYERLAETLPGARLRVIPAGASGYPDNIFDWLEGCRAVLTGSSMVAVEAMLMDVPVITMDFCDELHGVEFIDAGATLHATSIADIESRLHDVLECRPPMEPLRVNVANFLRDAFYALDGRSAERVADLLRSICKPSPSSSQSSAKSRAPSR